MGGKLFNAPRVNDDEYKRLQKYFADKFAEINRQTWFPDGFKKKETHGDLDIIVEGAAIASDELMRMFDLRHEWVSRNSNVISIYYEGKAQVDLCFHPYEECQTAFDYLRCADASNLIGKICHSLGFKLGHKGLVYPVNLSDCEQIGDVFISSDRKEILEFLDLDYQKWEDNFDDAEELYNWIVKSKYFNPAQFQYENLNHVSRIRDRKRPVYAGFIKWLQENPIQNEFVPGRNKAEYFWNALLFFDCADVLGKIEDMINTRRDVKAANKVFNGDLVREWTGLEGKELGSILTRFKEHCGKGLWSGDWTSFACRQNEEMIKALFSDWYKENRLTLPEKGVE